MARNKLINFTEDQRNERFLQRFAQEGIFDTLSGLFKKNKPAEKAAERQHIAVLSDYFDFAKGDLVKSDGNSSNLTIDIPDSGGAFFTPNWHVALAKDVQQYQAIFNQIKGPLTQVSQYLERTQQKLEQFHGNADHPEEFAKALKVVVDGEPKPLVERFRTPSHSFLAYDKTSFVEDGAFVTSDKTLYPKEKKQVQALTVEQFLVFRDTLLKLYLLATELDNFEYDAIPQGLDATDPPFRGYADIDQVTDLINQSALFYPVFEEKFSNIGYELSARVYELTMAMMLYAKKHVS